MGSFTACFTGMMLQAASLAQASMTFFDTKEYDDVASLSWHERLAEWLQSSSFEGIIAVALLANVLWMAVSLQVNGGKTGNELGLINDENVTADSYEWKVLTEARKMDGTCNAQFRWSGWGLHAQSLVCLFRKTSPALTSMALFNPFHHRFGKVHCESS